MDEESTEARVCRLHYAPTRDEILRAHRWNFAIKVEELVAVSERPAHGWEFKFALPTDCLRVLEMNRWEAGRRMGTWEIEGRYLMTDAETAWIKYIQRIVDCNLFDALFVEALSTKLAAKICMPINGSGPMAGTLLTEYEKVTGSRARRTDAFEQRSDRQPEWTQSELVASRFRQGMT